VRSQGLGGPSGRLVYGGGWFRAWFIGLFLAWGAMNFIAWAIERRTEMLLHPGGQYKALYYGASLCLPVVVVGIWYLGQNMSRVPNLSNKWLWHVVCFAFGLAYGIWWHLVKEPSYHFYTRSQMWSPTKLYNDFVVFPLYIYILASAGIPALMWSRWSKRGWLVRAVIVVLLVVFALLNHYDALHRPHHGHINFNWSRFSPEK
jgi:hypothetical protein